MNSTTATAPRLAGSALLSLLTQTVAALPGQWAVSMREEDAHRATLTRADGFTLYVTAGGYNNVNRLRFGYSRPRDDHASNGGYITLYEGHNRLSDPDITAADSKTPTQLAGDIARRLLPEAERIHALALAYLAQQTAARNARNATAERIAAALGQPMPDPADRNRDTDPVFRFEASDSYQNGYGDARISGQSVSFDLRNIPADKAVELCKWLTANLFSSPSA